MAANYLIRKGDMYYFSHCVPAAAQHLGKREFIKTLKVKEERICSNFKINLNITWNQIRQFVHQAFDVIYKKYVQSVGIYGHDFKDEYDPLKFIPPECEQYLAVEDSTTEWKNVPELQELADKIIQSKNLQLHKDLREYNLL